MLELQYDRSAGLVTENLFISTALPESLISNFQENAHNCCNIVALKELLISRSIVQPVLLDNEGKQQHIFVVTFESYSQNCEKILSVYWRHIDKLMMENIIATCGVYFSNEKLRLVCESSAWRHGLASKQIVIASIDEVIVF